MRRRTASLERKVEHRDPTWPAVDESWRDRPCPACDVAAGDDCVNDKGEPTPWCHESRMPLTPAGQHVRDRHAQPDAEREPGDPMRASTTGYVPCARQHQPDRICMLPDGHP